LAIALQDDNPEVRKNAIRDLTRIYDLVAQISQMLGHATEDEDPEVRQTANWALEQLGRIRKLPEMRSSSLPSLESQPHPADLSHQIVNTC
ncbi:MAG: HEAT repeat domain-containing protein, partial [Cyanobacteria bacterium J06632_22]